MSQEIKQLIAIFLYSLSSRCYLYSLQVNVDGIYISTIRHLMLYSHHTKSFSLLKKTSLLIIFIDIVKYKAEMREWMDKTGFENPVMRGIWLRVEQQPMIENRETLFDIPLILLRVTWGDNFMLTSWSKLLYLRQR